MTSDLAKHAIPKTAEVAYSIGVGELGWQYETGLKSHGTVTNWCTRRGWSVKLHDSYFCLMMIKTCHSKDGRSGTFRWPFMGRDWVGVAQEIQSVWRSEELENHAVEKTAPSRELGPWASGWAAQENEKETRLWPIEWGSICCSSVWSPTPSYTQPFQINWEVYFSKELCRLCRYDSLCMHLHMSIQQSKCRLHGDMKQLIT